MIQRQRRILVTLAAVSALAACKTKQEDGSGWKDRTGSGTAAAAGSGPAAVDTGSAAPRPGDPITRPFFYKVEKDGKTSHLVGTWHLGIDAEKQMPKLVWDALAGARAFAMETDPADPAGLSAMARNDGRTLEDDLGPEYWAKLEALAGPDVAKMVRVMKPFAATMLIQLKDLPQTASMDLAFAGKARDGKKEIVFLEQAMVQVRALERWIDLRVLKMTIDDLAGTQNKIADAMIAYLAGDEAALSTDILDREGMKEAGFTEAELDQALKQMLYDRNAAWIKTLEEMFAKGDAFVAVGAGHLVGPKSVVELLRAKGYTVTRVGA